ncbi:unnamed protein product [Auanema sp. JU1783]|nr:unnamed protein product [Auanema sp. JU1783]
MDYCNFINPTHKLLECRDKLRELAQRGADTSIEDLKNVYDLVVQTLHDIPQSDGENKSIRSLTLISHMLSKAAQFEANRENLGLPSDLIENVSSKPSQLHENYQNMEEVNTACQSDSSHKDKFDDFAEARRNAIESTIVRDIESLPVLTDIAGLTEAKNALSEALVDPILYPEWFSETDLKPWKSVLLYGPPGTGKTVLCHAAAREIEATLYQISSSDLISSWSGQSEKLIRELFDHAIKLNKVTVIFIDEIDSLCRVRCSTEDDSNRRVKTELLVQISKLQKTTGIMLVCATNCPWDLDPAFLRRFEKKIYVGLPSTSARISILRKRLNNTTRTPAVSYEWLAAKTEGFSGDDLRRFSSEIAYAQFRQYKERKILTKENAPCNPVSIGLIETVLAKFVRSVDEQQLSKFHEYMNK